MEKKDKCLYVFVNLEVSNYQKSIPDQYQICLYLVGPVKICHIHLSVHIKGRVHQISFCRDMGYSFVNGREPEEFYQALFTLFWVRSMVNDQ